MDHLLKPCEPVTELEFQSSLGGFNRLVRAPKNSDTLSRIPQILESWERARQLHEENSVVLEQLTGRETDIDRMLKLVRDIIPNYERIKWRNRVIYQVIHLGIFLVVLTVMTDWAFSFVADVWIHVAVITAFWFLEENVLSPIIHRNIEQWDFRELRRTVEYFYRIQRQMIYLAAILEHKLVQAEKTIDAIENDNRTTKAI